MTGITTSIEELKFELKGHVHHFRYTGIVDGPQPEVRCSHLVLLIRLKGEEEYSVDFTGAQFGFHEYVVPLNQYLETRVNEIISKDVHGNARAELIAVARDGAEFLDLRSVTLALNFRYAFAMEQKLVELEGSTGQTLDRTLNLRDAQYRKKTRELLEIFRRSIINCRKELVAADIIRVSGGKDETFVGSQIRKLFDGVPRCLNSVDGVSCSKLRAK